VLADRAHPLGLDAPARLRTFGLSAGSRRAIAALGVVYGDIGTSPLYAARQSLLNLGDMSEQAILGTISLIVWALMLVVTVKYVLVIMRASNRGEGGLLALTALVLRSTSSRGRRYFWIMAAGMVGAALFYGDGVITPAISVLSAVEGLKLATPRFEPYVVPISLVLLIGLFLVQHRGTAAIGGPFGLVMLVWFGVLGLLGAWGIVQHPRILLALDPIRGIALLFDAPWRGFVMLGSVFLAMTGAEALYADMGHFGRRAIRITWLRLVFPALILNYLGQGALLLGNPDALDHPFYRLVPEWGLYPLVALATAATIIASQAVISGAFSMSRHALQLGYLPRFEVRHTSEHEIGQVYAPRINGLLLVVIVFLVLHFRSSDNLGAAYGIAVSGMMAITTGLAFLSMRSCGWSLVVAVPVFAAFGLIDLTFFSSTLLKIFDGGWFPIVVAAVVFTIMGTWWRGRRLLAEGQAGHVTELDQFVCGPRSGATSSHTRNGDLLDQRLDAGSRGAAPGARALQGPGPTRHHDAGRDRGRRECPRRAAARDRRARQGLLHDPPALRLYGRAKYIARPRAMPGRGTSLQPDGNLLHHQTREAAYAATRSPNWFVAMAQCALHFHVKQYARRDRVFPAPAESGRRTGWSGRDLSEMFNVAVLAG
jgi:KUP system potassium uptake protein